MTISFWCQKFRNPYIQQIFKNSVGEQAFTLTVKGNELSYLQPTAGFLAPSHDAGPERLQLQVRSFVSCHKRDPDYLSSSWFHHDPDLAVVST